MDQQQRELVVAEAISWMCTPWHHRGRIKGVGVDCAMFIAEVFERTGIAPHVESMNYPPDWWMHRDEERFLQTIYDHGGVEIEGPPQMGDIVMYKFGRCYSHGGIVVKWPQKIVHAFYASRIVEYSHGMGGVLADKKMKFFTVI